MSDLKNPNWLRKLAATARQSELHDLKIGLAPAEVDLIADEIERLRANVHLAYYEGWDDAKHTFHIDVDVAWDRSEAKAALENDHE